MTILTASHEMIAALVGYDWDTKCSGGRDPLIHSNTDCHSQSKHCIRNPGNRESLYKIQKQDFLQMSRVMVSVVRATVQYGGLCVETVVRFPKLWSRTRLSSASRQIPTTQPFPPPTHRHHRAVLLQHLGFGAEILQRSIMNCIINRLCFDK